MIGYVTLGTNKFAEAATFYDGLLAELGAKRIMDHDTFIAWGNDPKNPALSILPPHDGNVATIGNGVMVALAAGKPAMVDKLYAKALELGGACEGKPGDRGQGFYAAYFRDLDGNKLNAFCMPSG